MKSLKSHRKTGDERNAEEKHYTMSLMKCAKLAQELTKLDALASNVLGYLVSAYVTYVTPQSRGRGM